MDTPQLNVLQTVFTIFYAFAWGNISEVQPRWRLFDPGGMRLGGVLHRRHAKRFAVAFFFFNVIPAMFFLEILIDLQGVPYPQANRWTVFPLVVSVAPALAHFGFYRLWLAQVETNPDAYYYYYCYKDKFAFWPFPYSFRQLNEQAIHLLNDAQERRRSARWNYGAALAFIVPPWLLLLYLIGEPRLSVIDRSSFAWVEVGTVLLLIGIGAWNWGRGITRRTETPTTLVRDTVVLALVLILCLLLFLAFSNAHPRLFIR